MVTVKARLQWVDIAKGLGILIVVLGHLKTPDFLFEFIYAFHMPLFVMLSGMFFNKNKVFKNIGKLLICHINMGLITSAVYVVVKHYSIKWFFKNIVNILLGGSAPDFRLDNAPALWFFTALVVIELFAFIYNWLVSKSGVIKYLFAPACIIFAYILAKFGLNKYIPYNVVPALFLFPFYNIGIVINSSEKIKNALKTVQNINPVINILMCMLFAFITFAVSHFNGLVNIYRSDYGQSIIFYYLGSLAGSAMLIIFSMTISRLKFFVLDYLKWLGRNTIVTMSIHQLLIAIASIMTSNVDLNMYLLTIIKFILIVMICSIATVAVNNYLPFLVCGKKKRKVNKAV